MKKGRKREMYLGSEQVEISKSQRVMKNENVTTESKQ